MKNKILSNMIIYKILGAHRILPKPNTKSLVGVRNHWALAIKTDGYTKYYCKNSIVTSDNQHIILIPEGAEYVWETSGGECLMLDFDTNLSCDMVYSYKVKDMSRIITLFNKIERNRIEKRDVNIKNLKHLYEILTILYDNSKDEYVPQEKESIIADAIDYITHNYNDPNLNIEKLSNISEISYVYFRKIFTQIHGVPPMEYINNMRMDRAGEILKSDYNSIESVALSVGYNSLYHFSKMFKQYYGMSPSQYAKTNK